MKQTSSNYPVLEEMGVQSFDQVSHFKVRRERNADVLKIYYVRPKGSLLSRSKKFTFVRTDKNVMAQYKDISGWEQYKGSCPRLQQAVAELTELTQPEQVSQVDQKTQFLNDLDHLEKVVLAKIEEMRRQVKELD
ncbi:DUF3461 family protein [Motiliproteus coralliicola]|uniref:DUF3461 family protein n=1 Tax=Motiliproteus coralliicola TaxID=2283196 RepID=A0A369WDM0_9GAMM|nr:DUF3461 family protein [Motiliproteus coralliicola]RDE19411.1 DUF3461 family protein [Motiliproteus coralliicola]